MIDTAAATTSREAFDALAAGHRVVPVVRELFADGETPVGIYRKLAAGRPGTFLLESAEQGGIWSRFSFVGAASFGVLTQQGDTVRWLDYGLCAERALGTAGVLRPLPRRVEQGGGEAVAPVPAGQQLREVVEQADVGGVVRAERAQGESHGAQPNLAGTTRPRGFRS